MLPIPYSMKLSILIYANLATVVSAAIPRYNSRAFDGLLSKRENSVNDSSPNLVVDLGYARYRGVANLSTGLDTWKG